MWVWRTCVTPGKQHPWAQQVPQGTDHGMPLVMGCDPPWDLPDYGMSRAMQSHGMPVSRGCRAVGMGVSWEGWPCCPVLCHHRQRLLDLEGGCCSERRCWAGRADTTFTTQPEHLRPSGSLQHPEHPSVPDTLLEQVPELLSEVALGLLVARHTPQSLSTSCTP